MRDTHNDQLDKYHYLVDLVVVATTQLHITIVTNIMGIMRSTGSSYAGARVVVMFRRVLHGLFVVTPWYPLWFALILSARVQLGYMRVVQGGSSRVHVFQTAQARVDVLWC